MRVKREVPAGTPTLVGRWPSASSVECWSAWSESRSMRFDSSKVRLILVLERSLIDYGTFVVRGERTVSRIMNNRYKAPQLQIDVAWSSSSLGKEWNSATPCETTACLVSLRGALTSSLTLCISNAQVNKNGDSRT